MPMLGGQWISDVSQPPTQRDCAGGDRSRHASCDRGKLECMHLTTHQPAHSRAEVKTAVQSLSAAHEAACERQKLRATRTAPPAPECKEAPAARATIERQRWQGEQAAGGRRPSRRGGLSCVGSSGLGETHETLDSRSSPTRPEASETYKDSAAPLPPATSCHLTAAYSSS